VAFDVRMLKANARKNGVNLDLNVAFDTMTLAKRLLNQKSNKLEDLSIALKLENVGERSHKAMDDVWTTIALTGHLKRVALRG
jgi:DNA polymerase III epsilon subunit-like protein